MVWAGWRVPWACRGVWVPSMDSNGRLLGDLNMEKYDFFCNHPLLTDPDNPNPYDAILNKCKFVDLPSFTSPLPNPLNQCSSVPTYVQCSHRKYESLNPNQDGYKKCIVV
jgi:hypothetical protein